MKTSAQEAYHKFAMAKHATAPWSQETPHAVDRVKVAIDKLRNTLARPKKDSQLTQTDVTQTGTNASVETPYISTAAFPWENKYLDNMNVAGQDVVQ